MNTIENLSLYEKDSRLIGEVDRCFQKCLAEKDPYLPLFYKTVRCTQSRDYELSYGWPVSGAEMQEEIRRKNPTKQDGKNVRPTNVDLGNSGNYMIHYGQLVEFMKTFGEKYGVTNVYFTSAGISIIVSMPKGSSSSSSSSSFSSSLAGRHDEPSAPPLEYDLDDARYDTWSSNVSADRDVSREDPRRGRGNANPGEESISDLLNLGRKPKSMTMMRDHKHNTEGVQRSREQDARDSMTDRRSALEETLRNDSFMIRPDEEEEEDEESRRGSKKRKIRDSAPSYVRAQPNSSAYNLLQSLKFF